MRGAKERDGERSGTAYKGDDSKRARLERYKQRLGLSRQ